MAIRRTDQNRDRPRAATRKAEICLRTESPWPDATTQEFDDIIAGGRRDRYAMAITLASYGTLLNEPKLSQTAGNWDLSVPPGRHSVADSRTSLSGWTLGV